MDIYSDIEKFVIKQIEPMLEKQDVTPDCIETLGEMVDILKDIETVWAMQDYSNGGEYGMAYNANAENPRFVNNYRSSGRYMGRGRYMDNMYGNNMYGNKQNMMRKLEEMRDEATDDNQRRAIEDFMARMGNM